MVNDIKRLLNIRTNLPDVVASVECASSQRFHRAPYRNLFKPATSHKSIPTYVLHLVRNRKRPKRLASPESFIVDDGYSLRNLEVWQFCTIAEGSLTDVDYALGNIHLVQTCAAVESPSLYALKSLWQVNSDKRLTIRESSPAYALHVVWNIHFLQTLTS